MGIRGGIDTVLSDNAAFQAELHRHGLNAAAAPDALPEAVLFGHSWHDYSRLRTPCGRGCDCATRDNSTWGGVLRAYALRCGRVAAWLSALARRGVTVVQLSLFPRFVPSNLRGAPPMDVMAAAADHLLHSALRREGFFEAGGRAIDQWPLYAAYQHVQARGKADYGLRLEALRPSIHSSPFALSALLTHNGSRIEADLINARLQLALAALCAPATRALPCGAASFDAPGRAAVCAPAECACPETGGAGSMDFQTTVMVTLCNRSRGESEWLSHRHRRSIAAEWRPPGERADQACSL